MKFKLDRTLCDGFGLCAVHAPELFSLDEWGYASLVGGGQISEQDEAGVRRALLDCPVHAIVELSNDKSIRIPAGAPTPRGATVEGVSSAGPHVPEIIEEPLPS